MIHEKNLKQKISWHCPFKSVVWCVKVAVTNPDIKGRREILVLYLSKIKHDSSVDIEKLAKMTVGGQS